MSVSGCGAFPREMDHTGTGSSHGFRGLSVPGLVSQSLPLPIFVDYPLVCYSLRVDAGSDATQQK